MTNPTLDRAKIEAIKAQSGSMDGGAIMFALVGDVRALCDLALEALSGAAPSVSASPVAPETVKEALRDMIGAYMHVAGNEYRGDIDGLVEELAPYVVGLRSTSDRAASPASPPRPVEAAPVAWPDRETLRRQIESDPDEGEIGAGFELFSERGQQELERLAFEALPKWAQEHIRDLERQIASPPREPEGVDAATVGALADFIWAGEWKRADMPDELRNRGPAYVWGYAQSQILMDLIEALPATLALRSKGGE